MQFRIMDFRSAVRKVSLIAPGIKSRNNLKRCSLPSLESVLLSQAEQWQCSLTALETSLPSKRTPCAMDFYHAPPQHPQAQMASGKPSKPVIMTR